MSMGIEWSASDMGGDKVNALEFGLEAPLQDLHDILMLEISHAFSKPPEDVKMRVQACVLAARPLLLRLTGRWEDGLTDTNIHTADFYFSQAVDGEDYYLAPEREIQEEEPLSYVLEPDTVAFLLAVRGSTAEKMGQDN